MSTPNKPRLLIVSTGLGRGGAENQILKLAISLMDDFDLSVVALVSGGGLVSEFLSAGIPVTELGMASGITHPTNLKGYVKLIRLTRDFQPDLIHGWQFFGNFAAVLVAKILRVPVITSKRGSNIAFRERQLLVERLTYAGCQRVLTNSKLLAEEIEALGTYADKIRVIPNGIDLEEYEVCPTGKGPWQDSGKVVVGTVGRFVREKRYEDLLLVARNLLLEFPELHFVWVGGRGSFEQIKTEIIELDLQDRITLTGEVEDVRPWLAQMDIFTLVSSQEGMPNVVMEAMASGKPIVATHVGGVPELVEDGENGFLVPAYNVDAISQRLKLLIQDSDIRVKMGMLGAERIKNFSTPIMCQRVRELYSALV